MLPRAVLVLELSDSGEPTESGRAELRVYASWNRKLELGVGEGEGERVGSNDWDDRDDFGVKNTSSSSDSLILYGLTRLGNDEEADIGGSVTAASVSSLLSFNGVHTSVPYSNRRGERVEKSSITKSIIRGISPDVLGDSRSSGMRIGDGGESVAASRRKSEDVRVRRSWVEENMEMEYTPCDRVGSNKMA